MEKKGLVIIGIVIAAIVILSLNAGTGLFSIAVGTNTYSLSCDDALGTYYHGASEGECIAYALGANQYTYKNAPQTLYKIESANEGQRYGPSGLQSTCKVVVSRDTDNCLIAKSSFGDLACTSSMCNYVNAVIIPDSCSNVGECLTVGSGSHVNCMANGKYSGTLYGVCSISCSPSWQCTAWSTCSNAAQTRTCTDSKSCNDISNKPALVQSCSSTTPTPTPTPINNYLLYGGIGVGALVVIMLLSKK